MPWTFYWNTDPGLVTLHIKPVLCNVDMTYLLRSLSLCGQPCRRPVPSKLELANCLQGSRELPTNRPNVRQASHGCETWHPAAGLHSVPDR